jgi:hypothetical protein
LTEGCGSRLSLFFGFSPDSRIECPLKTTQRAVNTYDIFEPLNSSAQPGSS